MKWEYKHVTIYSYQKEDPEELIKELNELGAEGWEVVQIDMDREEVFLKRNLNDK